MTSYYSPVSYRHKTLNVNKNNSNFRQGILFDTNGNPLPKGWQRVRSSSTNKDYYFNKYTFDTQWSIPYKKSGQNKYSPEEVHFTYNRPPSSGFETEIQDLPTMVGWRSQSGNDFVEHILPDDNDITTFRSSSSGKEVDYPDIPTILGWRTSSGTEFNQSVVPEHQEPVQTIIVTERCCEEKTQYPSRMCNESLLHTATATTAAFLDYAVSQDMSLDGIVEIRNQNVIGDSPHYQSVDYIRKIDPYLSDHDGIVLNLKTSLNSDNIPFNIISMNLEGLCKTSTDKQLRHINDINSYFGHHIKRGTIIVCQEIVLQTLAGLPIDRPHSHNKTWVDKTGYQILSKLRESNSSFRFESDTYTSGIFYDNAVWKLLDTVIIRRKYKDATQNKFSNAYLFQSHFDRRCKFWVVNIHLKAPIGTQEQQADIADKISVRIYNANPFRSIDSERKHYVNRMHIIELNNIISTLISHSQDFYIPVYLCGDYNNKLSKGKLVTKAMQEIENFTINDSDWELS